MAAGARGRPAPQGQAELQPKRPHPPASAKADEGPEGGGRRPRTCRWRGHPSWGRPGIQSPCALTGAAEQVLGGGGGQQVRSLSGWCQRRGQEGSGQVTGPSWKENVAAPEQAAWGYE